MQGAQLRLNLKDKMKNVSTKECPKYQDTFIFKNCLSGNQIEVNTLYCTCSSSQGLRSSAGQPVPASGPFPKSDLHPGLLAGVGLGWGPPGLCLRNVCLPGGREAWSL